MTLEKLCEIISLPEEVKKEVLLYVQTTESVIDEDLQKRLASRDSWDEAIKELQGKIGEDAYGFKILSELLGIACKTYEKYMELEIE